MTSKIPYLGIGKTAMLFCCLLQARPANATDAGTAGMAKMIGGVLVIHGAYSLYKDYTAYTGYKGAFATNCTGPQAAALAALCAEYSQKITYHGWKIPIDLLEMAGGAAAMMTNADSESDLKDQNGYMPDGSPGGSSGGTTAGGGGNIRGVCESMPQMCKIDPNTNRPQLGLIPKAEMKAAVVDSFAGKSVNADGLSLDDALKQLDEKYDQAAAAVAAFNAKSESGAFDGNDSDLASTAQGDGDTADGEGLANGRGLAGAAGGTPEMLTLPNGQTTDWNALLNKTKAERGPLSAANSLGMNLQDAKSGRVLSLWERVSRAIRGTRDRDILLAKVEWTRKEAAKKQGLKKPNVAVSTEKN